MTCSGASRPALKDSAQKSLSHLLVKSLCDRYCATGRLVNNVTQCCNFLRFIFILVSCLCVLCIMCVQCPPRPEGGVGFPETGVTHGCVLPCGSWKLNPGPEQEQQVYLTAEPFSSPTYCNFYHCS